MMRLLGKACGVLLVSAFWLCGGTANAQPSVLFYQNSQDQALSFDVDTLVPGPSVTGFLGASVGIARNIQADENDDLLWYSDTSGNIRSKLISSNTEAAGIVSATLFLGATPGADRHFSIDPSDNTLYSSVTDGTVQIIDLDTMTSTGSFSQVNFLGANLGGGRHTTVDPVNRLLYYPATDNAFYSFNLDTLAPGPSVPSNLIAGAATEVSDSSSTTRTPSSSTTRSPMAAFTASRRPHSWPDLRSPAATSPTSSVRTGSSP